ncbi:MAG TPA: hypothetical protein PKE12_07415 [Kiritimatiellia bacterium]|nr:hypothetical protein [Kiritimatiellia bacterium]
MRTLLHHVAGAGAALCIGLAPGTLRAATPFTETFAASLSGWTNGGSVVWTASGGELRADFPLALGPPNSAVLWAGPGASGGAFTGDYHAADIVLMGFSFRADTILPSSLILQWSSGTNSVFRQIKDAILATGVWYRLAWSMESPAAGGWVTPLDDLTFSDIQTNVSSIFLSVEGQSLSSTVRYRLDDFFIDRGHTATRFVPTTNGLGDVTWSYVRSNYTYRLDAASVPGGAWSNLAVLVANSTSLVTQVSVTNGASSVYRLTLP